MNVAVIGAGGYAGGELLRLLSRHPQVADCVAVSRSQAGRPIAEVHPALSSFGDLRFSDTAPADAARGRDVVFLALEHGESSKIAHALFAAAPGLVVDLAADFRVQDAALHERHYGPHAASDLRRHFVYGLADVCGASLRGARAVAVPGCFATAAALALYPLAPLALQNTPSVFAITGSSGAGTQPKPTTHHPARAHNVFSYSGLTHRHNAEVQEQWRRWSGRPEFPRVLVHAGPFVRGIYLTLHAVRAEPSREDPGERYRAAYEGRPFVHVRPHPPELTVAVGTNDALVHAAAGEDGRELLVTVAIDNLLKGAAGQAVQAMNLACGLPETAGLQLTGMYPC